MENKRLGAGFVDFFWVPLPSNWLFSRAKGFFNVQLDIVKYFNIEVSSLGWSIFFKFFLNFFKFFAYGINFKKLGFFCLKLKVQHCFVQNNLELFLVEVILVVSLKDLQIKEGL